MPSNERVTMAKIAELSGVSLSTVSLVLRDRPGIGPETRQRVWEVAKELGYLPPKLSAPYAPVLSSIGLILKSDPGYVPQPNKFYSQVVAGIEEACRRQGINLLYATLPVDEDSYPLDLPRILSEEDSTDGLLLVGAFVNEALQQVMERHSVPIVLVDAYAASGTYDAVVSDNFTGAYQAVSYLAERGHRHIGLVGCHPSAYPSIGERYSGYRQALAERGISDQYVAECHIVRPEEIVQATVDLLHSHPQITALFGVNDDVAIAVMEAVRQMGRQVPEDISVIGFDDIELAGCVSPALTTVHVDKIGMGRLAVQLLINRAERPETSPVKALICPRLIERQSVRSVV